MSETTIDPIALLKSCIGDMVAEVQLRMVPRGVIWKEHKTKIDQLSIIPFSFNNGGSELSRKDVIPHIKRFLPKVTEKDLEEIETLICQKDMTGSFLTNDVAEWYLDEEWGVTFRSNGCSVSFNSVSKKKIEQQSRKSRLSRR